MTARKFTPFVTCLIAALTVLFIQLYAQAASLLVEAESFANRGGWSLDQQFMPNMGSPYLLAHGLGEPVEDAVTTVTFPAAGQYQLWVRTKNWVPGDWEAPGRFQVMINNMPVIATFGTEPGWTWQAGGSVTINQLTVEVRLKDLTGFDGRCDALYFDTNPAAAPVNYDPANPAIDRQWRNQLRGLPQTPPDGGRFDVVIVGGGIAGCAAALAATEQGMQVALIHDRMALGGNASSEIRVHTLGVYGAGQHILEKIDTEHYPNGSPDALIDEAKRQQAMESAENLTMFRPYRAYDVVTEGAKIVSVDTSSTITGEALRIRSDIFIDCTGDGWIGYWAGADYRYGRESKNEFNEGWSTHGELWSPETPDDRIMGASLLWYSSNASSAVAFPEVPWAMDVAKDHVALNGEWYWEYTDNAKNHIDDAEEIRDHVLRAIYGSFANAKKNGSNPNRKLDWVGYLSGKRESRRLMGDYIYTMNDEVSGTQFEDAVVEETREIDVHFQQKEEGSQYDFLSEALYRSVPRYYVPFRCLYSRNIENLMMAGRCFSCSHVGLGGPRVMRTTGQMGIAVGYAASLCKKYHTTPRGIYQNYLAALKKLVYKTSPPTPEGWPEKIGPNMGPAATVIVSSNYNASTYPKSNLNDGKADISTNSTRWLSSGSSIPDTIDYIWSTPRWISACRIISGYKNGSVWQDPIGGFKFQTYQNGAWIDIPDSGALSNTQIKWFGTFRPIQSDRIRLLVSTTNIDISRIWEIEYYHPIADLSHDGYVDLSDLKIVSADWLEEQSGLAADLEPDNAVNIDDLIFLKDFWLWPEY